MSEDKVIKKLLACREALTGTVAQDEIVGAVLREAATINGYQRQSDSWLEQSWVRAKNDAGFQYLRAAAHDLMQLPHLRRLEVVENLLNRHDGNLRDFRWMWVQLHAANHIAEFSDVAQTVRCSGQMAMVPALLCGLRGRTVQFVAGSQAATELCDVLAALLEVKIETVGEQPCHRRDAASFDLEIMMPAIGSMPSEPKDLPDTTMNWLKKEAGSGRVSEEVLAIADALANATGRVLISVLQGTLFRTVGIEQGIRESLIQSGRLKAVFGLPGGSLYSYTQIKTSLLYLDESANSETATGKVRFIDLADPSFAQGASKRRAEFKSEVRWDDFIGGDLAANAEFARDVTNEAILAENAILSIERYFASDAADKVQGFARNCGGLQLSDLVDLIRPAPIRAADEETPHVIREAAPRDISERGYLSMPAKRTAVDAASFRKAMGQVVKRGDVLLSVKGTIGVVGLAPAEIPSESEEDIWIAGQSFMILRPKRRIGLSPIVLYEFLSSDTVQEYLRSIAGGTAIQTINMKDLKAFPVPRPDKETAARVEADHRRRQALYDEIADLQVKIAEDRLRSWPHSELS